MLISRLERAPVHAECLRQILDVVDPVSAAGTAQVAVTALVDCRCKRATCGGAVGNSGELEAERSMCPCR